MLEDHGRALGLALGLLVATVAVFLAVGADPDRGVVQEIDDAFLRAVVELRTQPLVEVSKALSVTGGVWVNWPVRVLALALLAGRRHWLQLAAFLLAIASSEVLTGRLKDLYDRPRPPGSLIVTGGMAFPSGHAVAATVTAVGMVIALLPPGRRRRSWELAAIAFAGVMALSRTYLSAHWLSDVVAGALLGATLALGWPALLQSWRDRRTGDGTAARSAQSP